MTDTNSKLKVKEIIEKDEERLRVNAILSKENENYWKKVKNFKK